jgi:hypothetical protein
MKIALVTCVWRRPIITEPFWYWTGLLRAWWQEAGITLTCVAAASTDEDQALAEQYGARTIRHRNAPLGAKFNAALRAAREEHPDGVIIMGSDDFFCPTAASVLAAYALRGQPVGFQDLYIGELRTKKVGYWPGYKPGPRYGEPAGCGTIHLRADLEAVGWTCWEDGQHRRMDLARFARLRKVGRLPSLINLRALGAVGIDVKSGENLWRYEQVQARNLSGPQAKRIWERVPYVFRDALPVQVAA